MSPKMAEYDPLPHLIQAPAPPANQPPPLQNPDYMIAATIRGNAIVVANNRGLWLDDRCYYHLYYLLMPIARRLNSWEEFVRWKDDVGPLDFPTLDLVDAWDNYPGAWIQHVVGSLVLALAGDNSLRRVATPSNLYTEIGRHPFLLRTLGDRATYSPLYRIRLSNGEETELELDDELLAGIALTGQPLVKEIHPAYSSLSYPPNFSQTMNREGLMSVSPDWLQRYEERGPYPLYRYSVDVLGRPYTFSSTNFLQGVTTAAQWLNIPLSETVSLVRDNETGQELLVQ